MSLSVNGSDLVHVINSNPTTDPGTTSNISIFAVGIVALVTICLLFGSSVAHSLTDKAGLTIPSGPRGLPIVGSFPFLTHYPELKLDRWAKKFGSLYSIWLGNQLFVIVSDPVIAKDLLVSNGNICSSRKDMFIRGQTIFEGRGITATPYNDKWRLHRRIAWGWLNQSAVNDHAAIFDREATVLLKALYDASEGGLIPVNPQPHAGRYSLNNMTTIVFGLRTDGINHPLVGRALKLNREFMNCTGPMSNLVDFLPILQYFPNPMQRRGRKLHQDLLETYGAMVKTIEQNLKDGVLVEECLAKTMLQCREKEGLDDLDIYLLASAFMIAGVESTAAIMQWFSAMIPTYPEVQKRAQDELDQVVGRDRLPTVEDEKNLPYCHAIIKEVERCYNPFWLGTPHAATEDFIYQGKFIPKDTVIVLNTWAMHHDPNRYPDPFLFNPDRYISDALSSAESACLPNSNDRDHWMFGAGRRICPGMIVAEHEIWLTISRMLWAFSMQQLPEEPINIKEYDGLSARSPVPYRMRLTPRDGNVEKVLDEALTKVEGLGGLKMGT